MGVWDFLKKKVLDPSVNFVGNLLGKVGRLAGNVAGAAKQLPGQVSKAIQNPGKALQAVAPAIPLLGPGSPLGASALLNAARNIPKPVENAVTGASNVIQQSQEFNPLLNPLKASENVVRAVTPAIQSFGRAVGSTNEGNQPDWFQRNILHNTVAPVTAFSPVSGGPTELERQQATQAGSINNTDFLHSVIAPSIQTGVALAPIGRGIQAGSLAGRGLIGGAKELGKQSIKTGAALAPTGPVGGAAGAYARGQEYTPEQAALDTAVTGTLGAGLTGAGGLVGLGLRKAANLVRPTETVKITPKSEPVTVTSAGAPELQGISGAEAKQAMNAIRNQGSVNVQPQNVITETVPSPLQRMRGAQPVIETRPGIKIVPSKTRVYEEPLPAEQHGGYDPNTDKVRVRDISPAGNETVVHEIAHRQYESMPYEQQAQLDSTLKELNFNNQGFFTGHAQNANDPKEAIAQGVERLTTVRRTHPKEVTSEINKVQGGRELIRFVKRVEQEAANAEKVPYKPVDEPKLPGVKVVDESKPQETALAAIPEPDRNVDTGSYIADVAKAEQLAKKEGKPANLIDEARKKLVDYLSPIEKPLNQARRGAVRRGQPIKITQDPSPQFDRVLRAPSIAGQYAEDRGLTQLIQGVPDVTKFDQYAKARHAIELEKRGIKTGRDIAKDQTLVSELAPEYEKYAAQATQYAHDMLDRMATPVNQLLPDGTHGYGLITPEVAKLLKERYPTYIPFNRIFSELESKGSLGTKAVASLSDQSVVQKIKGSEREVEPVLESLAKRTSQMVEQGEKNRAAYMVSELHKLPEFEGLIRKVEPGETAPTHGFSYLENGKKVSFETTPDIAGAIKRLGVENLGALGKIFAAPTRLFKVGTTGVEPSFLLTNLARDQLFGAITTKHALRTSVANPGVFVKAMFAATGRGDLYKQMLREGAVQTSFDISRNQLPVTVAKIRSQRSGLTKFAYTVRHPGEFWRTVENIVGATELQTRGQQYLGTYQGAIAKGATEQEAKILAAQAARESTANFNRSGEWGPALRSAFAYLNAGIQGSRSLIRGFQRRPAETAFKVASMALFPMAAITLHNLSDPKRKAAWDDMPDFEKDNNFIIMLNPHQDETGRWHGIIKIPITPGLSNLTYPVREALEIAHGENPDSVNRMIGQLTGIVSPVDISDPNKAASSLMPQAVKPAYEDLANYDTFTGRPIVPDYQKDKPKQEQYNSKTSGVSILLGQLFDKSPAKIDHDIKAIFGKVGLEVTHGLDSALQGTGLIPQVGGISAKEAISQRFTSATGTSEDQQYYGRVQEILKSLPSDKQRAAYEFLQSYERPTGDPFDSRAKATVLLQDDALRKAVTEIKSTKPGATHDPLFDLSDDQQKQILLSRYLPPGSDSYGYKKKLYTEKWAKDFQKREGAYFDSFETNPYVPNQLKGKLDTFNKLSEDKKQGYLERNADVAKHLQEKSTPVKQPDRPEASPELQSKLDYYNTLPSGTGARSQFLAANPDVIQFFTASKQFSNQQLATMGLIPQDQVGSFSTGGGYSRRRGRRGRGGRSSVKIASPKLKTGVAKTRVPKYKKSKVATIKITSGKKGKVSSRTKAYRSPTSFKPRRTSIKIRKGVA